MGFAELMGGDTLNGHRVECEWLYVCNKLIVRVHLQCMCYFTFSTVFSELLYNV